MPKGVTPDERRKREEEIQQLSRYNGSGTIVSRSRQDSPFIVLPETPSPSTNEGMPAIIYIAGVIMLIALVVIGWGVSRAVSPVASAPTAQPVQSVMTVVVTATPLATPTPVMCLGQ